MIYSNTINCVVSDKETKILLNKFNLFPRYELVSMGLISPIPPINKFKGIFGGFL